MPIEQLHPEVEKLAPVWTMVEDCVDGPHAVKDRGVDYLPTIAWKQDAAAKYKAYKQAAWFWNIARRAKMSMEGLINRKPLDWSIDPSVMSESDAEAFMTDVTGCLESIDTFARQALGYAISPGRVGILVDAAEGSAEPYLRTYTGANVRNWSEEVIDGERVLTAVRLTEVSCERVVDEDEFREEMVERIRLVELVVRDDAGNLLPMEAREMRHRIFEKAREGMATPKGSTYVEIGEPVIPMRRGKPIPFIPFVFVNQTGLGADPEPPQLADLCEVLLSMYRNSADLERNVHLLAPTLTLAGLTEDPGHVEYGGYIYLGSNSEARAEFVQASDNNASLLALIDAKAKVAVHLAASMLERSGGVETAEAVRLKQASDSSVLATIAYALSRALSEVMAYRAWWAVGAADDVWGELDRIRAGVSVKLNDDFESVGMTAEEARQWAELQLQGFISKRTLLAKYEAGEVYPEGVKAEDEERAIAEEGAEMGRRMVGADEDDEDDEGEDRAA